MHHLVQQVHDVRVINLLELGNQILSVLEGLTTDGGDVDENSHAELFNSGIPLDKNFAFIFG